MRQTAQRRPHPLTGDRLVAERGVAHERWQVRIAAQHATLMSLGRLLRARDQAEVYRRRLLWQWQRRTGEPYRDRKGVPEAVERAPTDPTLGQAAIVRALSALILEVPEQPLVLQPTYRAELDRIWRLLVPNVPQPANARPRCSGKTGPPDGAR
jgi:hypothetical protein